MIDSIRISGVATYGEDVELTGLAEFNYFFGPNGSGKTTISRIIQDVSEYVSCEVRWRKSKPLETLVYNSDFVAKHFHQDSELPGIFTLGEENAATLARIAELKLECESLDSEVERLTLTLQGDNGNGGKKADLAATETALRDRCWDAYKKHQATFRPAFDGVRDKKEKFLHRFLKERSDNVQQLQPLEALIAKAKTVFSSTAATVAPVSGLPANSFSNLEIAPVLGKKIVGKSDIDIAALIDRLGASDWVRLGRTFYDSETKICPFCQQATPEQLEFELSAYFDEQFLSDTKAIADVEADYRTQGNSLLRTGALITV